MRLLYEWTPLLKAVIVEEGALIKVHRFKQINKLGTQYFDFSLYKNTDHFRHTFIPNLFLGYF